MLTNYKKDNSSESLEKLETALSKNQLYFNKFFNNDQGKEAQHTGNYAENGKFLDFAVSQTYPIGELLQMNCEGKGMVFVQTSDITLA